VTGLCRRAWRARGTCKVAGVFKRKPSVFGATYGVDGD
jgi:hypothetical protein